MSDSHISDKNISPIVTTAQKKYLTPSLFVSVFSYLSHVYVSNKC